MPTSGDGIAENYKMADTVAPALSPEQQLSNGRLGDLLRRLGSSLHAESLLIAVLAGSFLTRWLLADWNSYWLDELLSVNVYGLWHSTVTDALRNLAENSIHPPLYQFILYHWMSWFGDSELATRSLSNLYVTLAALFLYLTVRDALSRRVALASVVAFSLMYTPMFYGLETRSYAQTIFLVTLSSYVLLHIMHTAAERGWRLALISPLGSLFTLANAALLLTHYYNAFFWVAQAIIVGVFLLREQPPRRWPTGAGVLAGIYGFQAALFLGVWGRVFLNDFRRRAGDFAIAADEELRGPFDLLVNSVVTLNIDPPRLIAWVGMAIAAVVLFRAIMTVARRGHMNIERRWAWTVIYLTAWLILPLVVVYITFSTVGVARYSARFFAFTVVPLAPLVVLTVEEAARLAGHVLARLRGTRPHAAWSMAATVVVIATLIAPGAQAAATQPRHDWRGIVRQVVSVVQADESSDYIIFETAHRRRPMTNFYFERFSNTIRAYDTVQRFEERQGQYRILTVDEPVIAEHDYLILLFTHSRTSHFPNVLEQLEERYEVRHRQLNHVGRGFIVFDVRDRHDYS